MTLSSREKPLVSENNSFMAPFLLCSYFRTHPTTLLFKIFGGTRERPPVPPRSPSANPVKDNPVDWADVLQRACKPRIVDDCTTGFRCRRLYPLNAANCLGKAIWS